MNKAGWWGLGLVLATVAVVRGAETPSEGTYQDPFAYCAAVGTVDAPDARYRGPTLPESVTHGLQRELGLSGAPSPAVRHAVWRCLDGKVYACTVGANLPCRGRARVSRTPGPAMANFCKTQPGAEVIPAVVSGRATVYEWRCEQGVPTIERQVFRVDARGFIADIWYPIAPP